MVVGERTSILLPPLGDNACPRELRARYVLVEADELPTSQDPTRGFARRPGYPAELQPRDYPRDPAEQLKVTRGVCIPRSSSAPAPTGSQGLLS